MIQRDWKEAWVDRMGLIVALSGEERFRRIKQFVLDVKSLEPLQRAELWECLRQRFTPSSSFKERFGAAYSQPTAPPGT